MKFDANEIQDYYQLLGVDPQDGSEKIRQAYRDKIKLWHPDRNAHRLQEAEEMTKILNAAYHVLKDPERRAQYDRILRYAHSRRMKEGLEESAFLRKLRKASPALGQMVESVQELYHLFADAIQGEYRLHPTSLVVIAGGLLYFVVPVDLIPDVLPIIGLVDDLAVLSTVINSMQTELDAYRRWKGNATAA